MPKPTHVIIPWPEDGSTAPFEDLILPIRKAIKAAYSMRRRRAKQDVPYHGYDIGQHVKAGSFGPDEALTAANLAYSNEDQGRDALDVILGLAMQIGIEQGRRIERERIDERLALVKSVMADHRHVSMLDMLK